MNQKNMENKKEATVFVSKGYILGAFANWAVRQSPYYYPENLEAAVRKANEILIKFFGNTKKESESFKELNYTELSNICIDFIQKVPEVVSWNERKNGNKSEYSFVSRYDSPHPDNDFIDLHALSRNITNQIFFEQYDSHSIPEILQGEAKRI